MHLTNFVFYWYFYFVDIKIQVSRNKKREEAVRLRLFLPEKQRFRSSEDWPQFSIRMRHFDRARNLALTIRIHSSEESVQLPVPRRKWEEEKKLTHARLFPSYSLENRITSAMAVELVWRMKIWVEPDAHSQIAQGHSSCQTSKGVVHDLQVVKRLNKEISGKPLTVTHFTPRKFCLGV